VGEAVVFVDHPDNSNNHTKIAPAPSPTTTTQKQQQQHPRLFGTIVENRGRGWYKIRLDDKVGGGDGNVVTARGTQLSLRRDGDSTLSNDTASSPALSMKASLPLLSLGEKESAGNETAIAPPPPATIVDLDSMLAQSQNESATTSSELLQQLRVFSNYSKWLVFTDLHCSPSTLDTSLQVLHRVHELALERNAGVLFLGDFWHHRGTLRVDCLNAVLDHFATTWEHPTTVTTTNGRSTGVPMILIPGNHDQVTLGGHNHALTPLSNAYRIPANTDSTSTFSSGISTIPGPLVMTHPTKFGNALFVPYIRDHATMESVLHSAVAREQAVAIFCHADVTGAYMNDLIPSQGGVPPSAFPCDIPIYSGHFHKPHTVQSSGRSIEYLGSPYQVSLSEAQQQKALVLLDAEKGWSCVERIPIDIGRKHFRVVSVDEFVALRPVTSNGGESAQGVENAVYPGDRVVVSLQKSEFERLHADYDDNDLGGFHDHVKLLRKTGATVELRELKGDDAEAMGGAASGIDASTLEDLSPESVWTSYLQEDVRRQARLNESAQLLVEAGLEIIEEVQAEDESFRPLMGKNATTELDLESVSIEGFGPFRNKVTYPLYNRGLVLVRGTNLDGGSDR